MYSEVTRRIDRALEVRQAGCNKGTGEGIAFGGSEKQRAREKVEVG